MDEIIKIGEFILFSFIHIWPYLFISIPLAVIVKISGAAHFIHTALSKKPVVSILLATIVGAFSPFCSCGVIPIIATMLTGGVPIAPVMSFWIASPSMDPEIFFLSVAAIGWKLSVWRLAATFLISLLSGYIMHILILRGFISNNILRKKQMTLSFKPIKIISEHLLYGIKYIIASFKSANKVMVQMIGTGKSAKSSNINCCISINETHLKPEQPTLNKEESYKRIESAVTPTTVSFREKLYNETWKATLLITKFMMLAFFVSALITFYAPQDFSAKLLGGNSPFSVIIATLVGIPAYTSNLTALPLISGLLNLGMNPGAALAFLIAGPVTTIPAMLAVWGIVRKKIFFLYISFALSGAVLFGIIYNFIN